MLLSISTYIVLLVNCIRFFIVQKPFKLGTSICKYLLDVLST